MPDAFDPYFKWLGIPKADQPPHAYRLLGIELFESDDDVICNAADGRMAQVKSFQSGKFAALSQKLLNEIAAAKVCLLNPQKKAEYDRRLRAHLQEKSAAATAVVEKVEAAEGAVAAVDSVAGLQFLDYSTAPKRSPTRSAKKSKQPAWVVPTVVGAGTLAVVAAVAACFLGGDGKGKPSSSQTASLPGGDREAQRNQPAKSTDKPARGASQPSPKQTSVASTAAIEKPHAPVALSSAAPAPPAQKPETKPKIELAAETEKTPSRPAPLPEEGSEKNAPPEKAPEKPAPPPAPLPSGRVRPAEEGSKKPSAPDKEEYQAKRNEIVKIYQQKTAEARTSEAKLALAAKLDKQGDASKDPVDRYSLWRIAAERVSEAGGFSQAMEIVDKIQAEFDDDGETMKADLLKDGAARSTLTPEAARDLCETALKLADTAVSREDFDAAAQFAKLATASLRRTKDPDFKGDALARSQKIERQKTRFAVVAKARETLDGDARQRGRQSDGRPVALLRQRRLGKRPAAPDQGKPRGPRRTWPSGNWPGRPTAKGQAALADAWWAVAEKDHGDFKSSCQARAVYWYREALPKLSPLEKTRVEETARSQRAAAGTARAGNTGPRRSAEGQCGLGQQWNDRGGTDRGPHCHAQ